MEYKLLALDLDGTLLEPDKTIPPHVVAHLRGLMARGIIVTLATGRMFTSARKIALDLGITAPLVVYNGAVVRRANDDQALFETLMPLDLMREVFAVGEAHGYYLQLYNDECIVVEKRTRDTEIDPDLHNVPCREVGTLSRAALGRTPKIMTVTEPADIPARRAVLEAALPGKLYLAASAPHLLEMMCPNVSKAASLDRLAARFGLSAAECVVCGDSSNDAEMVKWAGMGCAVGNAIDALKSVARYISPYGHSAGVLDAVCRFFPE